MFKNGLAYEAALELTSNLIYAFGWGIEIRSRTDKKQIFDRLYKKPIKDEKFNTKQTTDSEKKSKLESIDKVKNSVADRYDNHSNKVFTSYIVSFWILFGLMCCVFIFFILSFVLWSNNPLPIAGANAVIAIGIGIMMKLLKDSFERYSKYDALSYFLIISENGKSDIISAVFENFPKI